MWFIAALGLGLIALAHTAPLPFVLDAMAGRRAVWHMSRADPPTIYLTYDDGPNPTTTPDLLDALKREQVAATFFLIDRHITDETAPIVRRIVDEGHAIALHSHTRRYMIVPPGALARTLRAAADRIEQVSGSRPCRAFRPHAGWRSGSMYEALNEIDHDLIGWGWMLWDWNWFRKRTAPAVVERVGRRARGGDIVVLHDGNHKAPTEDQRHTVEATVRLIPLLREKGLRFGTICDPRSGG